MKLPSALQIHVSSLCHHLNPLYLLALLAWASLVNSSDQPPAPGNHTNAIVDGKLVFYGGCADVRYFTPTIASSITFNLTRMLGGKCEEDGNQV